MFVSLLHALAALRANFIVDVRMTQLIGHGTEKENISAYFRDLQSKKIKKIKKIKKNKKNRNYFKDVAQFSLLDLF